MNTIQLTQPGASIEHAPLTNKPSYFWLTITAVCALVLGFFPSSLCALEEGDYTITCKANNQILVLGKDNLLGQVRTSVGYSHTSFRLKKTTPFGYYYIIPTGTNNRLHENGHGDKLISTRWNPNDDYVKVKLEKQTDGSYRIKTKATNRYWHVNAARDKLVSTRFEQTDDYTKFIFAKSHTKGRHLGMLWFTFTASASNEAQMYRFRPRDFHLTAQDKLARTYILIHGFKGNAHTLGSIRNSLINEGKNVITVDWSTMSGFDRKDSLSYNWVLHRMWFVGWRLADEIKSLGLDPAKTELIGYSLGAHIAGTAGHRYHQNNHKKLNQIIGLDAAGQYMTHIGADVRLTKGDATKVIGIHSSDAAHFGSTSEAVGWASQYGDLDIYIYTKLAREANGTGQLLGSGSGGYRNQHDYANTLYNDLVQGNRTYKFANKWTWNEGDFKGRFSLQSLDSKTGTVTVWHE